MQTVAREQEWKEIHERALLNETFVEVSLEITDPDALADAEAEDNGGIYTSQSAPVTKTGDRTTHPYCTLEQNLWCLDGSRRVIPESNFEDDTYTSDVLSDETCVFSSKRPTISICFDETHNKLIPGVTITWSKTYNEYADTFEIIVYKEGDIIITKEVTGNKSIETMVLFDFIDYDRVEVIIKKWCLPYRRARVEAIILGLSKVYGKGDLFSYSHKQHVDPISTSLPKSEITFSVDNVNREYDIQNPNSLAKYLTKNQEVKVRYGLKMDDGSIEWVNGGVFYLSEWYAKQNGMTADFTARDLFGFMSDIVLDSDILWEPVSGVRRISYVVEELLKRANLPQGSSSNPRWVISESLRYVRCDAPVDTDTVANNLQLLANAGKCVLYQDRDGIIHIEPLNNEDSDYEISNFNSYTKSESSLSTPVKQVRVKKYAYYYGPAPDYELLSRIDKEIHYPADEDIPNGVYGETIIVDNPYVSVDEEALGIAEWMYNYLNNRMNIESSWRADVRMDALDIVKNRNDYGTNRVRMTDIEYTYNGAFRATGKGRVIENG